MTSSENPMLRMPRKTTVTAGGNDRRTGRRKIRTCTNDRTERITENPIFRCRLAQSKAAEAWEERAETPKAREAGIGLVVFHVVFSSDGCRACAGPGEGKRHFLRICGLHTCSESMYGMCTCRTVTTLASSYAGSHARSPGRRSSFHLDMSEARCLVFTRPLGSNVILRLTGVTPHSD